MGAKKLFVISEETRKRCAIQPVDDAFLKNYGCLSMELFGYLDEVDQIDFTIYFRVGDQVIEFIRPKEFSKELLAKVNAAVLKDYENLLVYIKNSEKPKFLRAIDRVRSKKIDVLLQKDPHLDRRVIQTFSNLSAASQMIVRGGIDENVASTASAAAGKMLDTLMDSEVAIGTLSRMVSCDPTLYDHSASVAMIAGVISTQILKKPLPRIAAEVVSRAGLYHDVGKTCIPNHILNKPGSFTEAEFEVMKKHTTLGYEELCCAIEKGAPIEGEIARVALEHHERFTGGGYPHGRKGRLEDDPENGIHLYSRIVMIADVYSALLMKRVYKPAYDSAQAIKIMSEIAEREYDPEIFIPFLKNVVKSLNYYRTKEKEASKGRILMIGDDGKVFVKK